MPESSPTNLKESSQQELAEESTDTSEQASPVLKAQSGQVLLQVNAG